MSDTSEKLGIEFTVDGLKEALAAFVALRKESQATGKALAKSFAAVAGPRQQATQGMNLPALLKAATISAAPSSGVSVATSGSNLRISITLRAAQYSAGTRGSSMPVAPRQPAYRFPSGPRQQMARLYEAMHMAAIQNNDPAFYDAKDAYMRLHARMNPKPQSAGSRWWSVLMTSRFGGEHGGLQPLVGKTLDAAGGRDTPMGRGLLGFTILGTAAVGLAKAFFHVTETANQFVLSQVQLQASTGGTAHENALLRGIGIASGQSDSEMSGLTKSLQQSISQPGFGMIYGMKAGVFNLPGSLGNQDWAADEIKVANYLRRLYQSDKSPNHGETYREARALGQDALMPSMQLPNKDWQDAINAGLSTEQSPARMIQAIKFQVAQGKLEKSWDTLIAAITGQQGVITAMNKFSGALIGAANFLQQPLIAKDPAYKPPKHLGFNTAPDGHLDYAWKDGDIKFAAASARAMEVYRRSLEHRSVLEHRNAGDSPRRRDPVRNHPSSDAASAVKDLVGAALRGGGIPGVYGNGSRGSAVPRALDTGFILNKYLASKALQLSSF